MSKFLSQNQLSWFQQIFHERFGVNFIFENNNDHVALKYDQGEKAIIFSNLDEKFYKFGETDLECYEWNAESEDMQGIIDSILIAPSAKPLSSKLINFTEDGAQIYYDILGLTYWMLNRLEEISRVELDNHERFSAKSSHAWKYNYLDRPIVDEWLDILKQIIHKIWPNIVTQKHQFQLNITHDVDRPSRFGFAKPVNLMKSILGDVVKRKNISSLFLGPYIRLNNKNRLNEYDPFNTFEWIMDISEANSLKSAFYFICGNTDPSKDADYNLSHPAIRKLLLDIYLRGHEIGLHPSYNCYANPQELANELHNLKNTCLSLGISQNVWGGRMHFLRWKHPDTLVYLNNCGLDYDSTLGYADYAGFRAGTCYEYTAFDPIQMQVLNIKIKPLIVMECSILHERYMGVKKDPLEIFKDLKSKCEKVNGIFTLLWHNSEFVNPQYRKIYEGIF